MNEAHPQHPHDREAVLPLSGCGQSTWKTTWTSFTRADTSTAQRARTGRIATGSREIRAIGRGSDAARHRVAIKARQPHVEQGHIRSEREHCVESTRAVGRLVHVVVSVRQRHAEHLVRIRIVLNDQALLRRAGSRLLPNGPGRVRRRRCSSSDGLSRTVKTLPVPAPAARRLDGPAVQLHEAAHERQPSRYSPPLPPGSVVETSKANSISKRLPGPRHRPSCARTRASPVIPTACRQEFPASRVLCFGHQWSPLG